MLKVNVQILIFILTMAIGYIAKRLGGFKGKDAEAITRLLFNITLPCLAFTKLTNTDIKLDHVFFIALAFTAGISLQLITQLVMFKKSKAETGKVSVNASGFSVGLFAYPIVAAFWPEHVIYIAMFDMGNSLIVFGLNAFCGSIFSDSGEKAVFKSAAKKMLSSVPFLAYSTAMIMSILHIPFPTFLHELASFVAQANMPAAMILLGAMLTFKFSKTELKSITKLLIIRYSFGITAGMAIFLLLPFSETIRSVALLGMLCPIGVSSIAVAVQYKHDVKYAAAVNNTSIMISFALIWLLFGIILPQLGLVHIL